MYFRSHLKKTEQRWKSICHIKQTKHCYKQVKHLWLWRLFALREKKGGVNGLPNWGNWCKLVGVGLFIISWQLEGWEQRRCFIDWELGWSVVGGETASSTGRQSYSFSFNQCPLDWDIVNKSWVNIKSCWFELFSANSRWSLVLLFHMIIPLSHALPTVSTFYIQFDGR